MKLAAVSNCTGTVKNPLWLTEMPHKSILCPAPAVILNIIINIKGIRKVSSCSYRRRAVGIAEHGVERSGEVVRMSTTVIFLSHGNQTGQAHYEQE